MRGLAGIGLVCLLVACGNGATLPVEYRDLSGQEAARRFFERGVLREGLWSFSVKIDSASIASLPDDSPDVRAVIGLLSERFAAQPAVKGQACLSLDNVDKAPGFSRDCRYSSLRFEEDGGSSAMTCPKAAPIGAGTITARYKFSGNRFDQESQLEGVTDLGGLGKSRPRIAAMTTVWTYLGACPATGPAGSKAPN